MTSDYQSLFLTFMGAVLSETFLPKVVFSTVFATELQDARWSYPSIVVSFTIRGDLFPWDRFLLAVVHPSDSMTQPVAVLTL